jgi:hypothetical protein
MWIAETNQTLELGKLIVSILALVGTFLAAGIALSVFCVVSDGSERSSLPEK